MATFTEYSIVAEYMPSPNGRSNDDGVALAAEMNRNLMVAGKTTCRDAAERELHTVSAETIKAFRLSIVEQEFEIED